MRRDFDELLPESARLYTGLNPSIDNFLKRAYDSCRSNFYTQTSELGNSQR